VRFPLTSFKHPANTELTSILLFDALRHSFRARIIETEDSLTIPVS
jgi:hypothetical protein